MCTRISLASLKVIPDEKLTLFSLHESIAIERKHFFGKFDEAVYLTGLCVESEAGIVSGHYRTILFD